MPADDDGPIASVMREMRLLRGAIDGLAEQAEKFVPRDEFDEVMNEREFRRHQYILTAVALAILFVAGAWGFYQVAAEVRNGTRCMVEQMVEHRFAARAYDRKEAEHMGYEVNEKDLPPLPDIQPGRLDACDQYENNGKK